MESPQVEHLDHFGPIMSVIKDLHFIEMIDARLAPDEQEALTPGEAVVGMILNGLRFSNRPLSLTPQFFAHKLLDLLLYAGVHADLFKRFTLGRIRDEVYGYGCARLLSELALAICTQEGMDLRFHHLDTTRFAPRGAYGPERDEQAITLTHGYAKDHRSDSQQAVLALMASQDGGGHFVSKSWDGKASETQMFQEHAAALMTTLQCLKNTTRYHRIALCPYGMAQRWLVMSSQCGPGARRGQHQQSSAARSRGQCQATLTLASHTV